MIESLEQSKRHHLPSIPSCHFALAPSGGETEAGGCRQPEGSLRVSVPGIARGGGSVVRTFLLQTSTEYFSI